jgi:two-component system response regulator PilR (NtrC family)
MAINKLGDFDKEIKTVDNGKDAIAEIDSRTYDLCFFDIHIPEGNGLDLMRRTREVSPGTKVVMMTSHYLDDIAKKEIEENSYRFVSKPFSLFQVREIVQSAFSGGDGSFVAQ